MWFRNSPTEEDGMTDFVRVKEAMRRMQACVTVSVSFFMRISHGKVFCGKEFSSVDTDFSLRAC